MITDDNLYTIAIFLGVFAMFLIVLYHFLEVNRRDDTPALKQEKSQKTASTVSPAVDVTAAPDSL